MSRLLKDRRHRNLLTLSISRELLELRVVDLAQFRAAQSGCDLAHSIRERCDHIESDIRFALGCSLICQTSEVVVLDESAAVEYAAGQVSNIDAGERIRLAGVAVKAVRITVCYNRCLEAVLLTLRLTGISDKSRLHLWRPRGSRCSHMDMQWHACTVEGVSGCPNWVSKGRCTYPVIGNTLIALLGGVATGRARDSEPALNRTVGQQTVRIRLAVVGHEAVDEGVRSRLNQHSCERAVEEVWIVGNLGVETLGAELGKGLQSHLAPRGHINQLLELVDSRQVVVPVFVEVRTCRRSIGLVPASSE